MSRLWVKSIAVLSVCAGVAALIPACAHNDESFFLDHVIAPPVRQGGTGCIYQPTRDSVFLSSGSLDVAVARSYLVEMLAVNQLVAKAKVEEVRIETSNIQVNGATVRVTTAEGTLLDEYTNITTSTIAPGNPGVVSVIAVSPKVVNAFVGKVDKNDPNAAALGKLRLCDRNATQIVIATIKVFGRTLGGTDIESNEFAFPVSACRGCLVNFGCAGGVTKRCDGIPVSTTDESCKNLPCIFGQDTPIACQVCGSDDACDLSKASFCP